MLLKLNKFNKGKLIARFGLAWQSNGEAFHSIDLRPTRPKPEGAATNRLIFCRTMFHYLKFPPTFFIKINFKTKLTWGEFVPRLSTVLFRSSTQLFLLYALIGSEVAMPIVVFAQSVGMSVDAVRRYLLLAALATSGI